MRYPSRFLSYCWFNFVVLNWRYAKQHLHTNQTVSSLLLMVGWHQHLSTSGPQPCGAPLSVGWTQRSLPTTHSQAHWAHFRLLFLGENEGPSPPLISAFETGLPSGRGHRPSFQNRHDVLNHPRPPHGWLRFFSLSLVLSRLCMMFFDCNFKKMYNVNGICNVHFKMYCLFTTHVCCAWGSLTFDLGTYRFCQVWLFFQPLLLQVFLLSSLPSPLGIMSGWKDKDQLPTMR